MFYASQASFTSSQFAKKDAQIVIVDGIRGAKEKSEVREVF